MPYQHYIPATYLANFSSTENLKRRRSTIWIADKTNHNIRESTVERVCGENDFYEYPGGIKKTTDSLWTYEGNLHEAFNELILGQVSAKTWLNTLIPFVVCLFIRSKDFEKRFSKRITSLGMPFEKKNINHARFFEIQRLLTPVLSSEWIVLTVNGEENLLINDVGFIPYKNYLMKHQGFAIPLDKRHILALSSRRSGNLLYRLNGEWFPTITCITRLLSLHLFSQTN